MRENSCFIWENVAKNVAELSFGCSAGDALDVELLHDDEQHRDRDGHDYAPCAELGKVAVAVHLVHHGKEAQRYGLICRYAGGHDDRCVDEVHPGMQEGADDGVHHNGLGQGQDNPPARVAPDRARNGQPGPGLSYGQALLPSEKAANNGIQHAWE